MRLMPSVILSVIVCVRLQVLSAVFTFQSVSARWAWYNTVVCYNSQLHLEPTLRHCGWGKDKASYVL